MKFSGPLLFTKLKATAIHFALSFLIFAYLAYQIYYNWYPQPYFGVDGGWQGMRLVASVDLVLGPLITFLIFDLRKPIRLIIFDLAIILAIQFGALAYGIHATYSQRPVAIVMLDEFVISAIHEQYGESLDSLDRLREFSDEKPPIILARIPLDSEKLAESNRIMMETGALQHAQIGLYRPKKELVSWLKQLQVLFGSRLDSYGAREQYLSWLEHNGKSADEVLVAPFVGRYGDVWLVFDLDGSYLSYFHATSRPGGQP